MLPRASIGENLNVAYYSHLNTDSCWTGIFLKKIRLGEGKRERGEGMRSLMGP